jgi:hypothetical protein
MKVSLHYFDDEPNFGDLISPVIVDALLDDSVERVSEAEQKLSAVGSVITSLADGTQVWGSGVMTKEMPSDKLSFMRCEDPRLESFYWSVDTAKTKCQRFTVTLLCCFQKFILRKYCRGLVICGW